MTFSFHHKILYSFGFVLFGVLFFLTPIKANAYNYSASNSGRLCQFAGTTPFTFNPLNGGSSWNTPVNFNLNIDSVYQDYGNLEYSSFDLNVSLTFSLRNQLASQLSYAVTGSLTCEIYVQYNDYQGRAQTILVGNSGIGVSVSTSKSSNVIDFTFPCTISGTPTGAKVKLNCPSANYGFTCVNSLGNNSLSLNDDLDYIFTCSITNFSDTPDSNTPSGSGASSGSNIIKNNIPIGYSNLNLGVNGDLYFLRTGAQNSTTPSSIIFPSTYLSPISFYIPDASVYLNDTGSYGYNTYINLGMGDYCRLDSSSFGATGSPIAVVGDTRPGDYCITCGFSTSSPQNNIETVLQLSRWQFEFNLGWTGEQFPMPSDATVSYCYFQDSQSGLYYLNIYFFFTTTQTFDSFIMRQGPVISPTSSIKEASFNFSKYVGTINDQLNKMDDQWNANIPNHSSFAISNSSTQTALNSMSSIESQSFDRLDSSIQATGIDSFNLNVVSGSMATVSAMITRIYEILPDKLKFVILAVLTLGIFAVIIRAGSYASGKNGG